MAILLNLVKNNLTEENRNGKETARRIYSEDRGIVIVIDRRRGRVVSA